MAQDMIRTETLPPSAARAAIDARRKRHSLFQTLYLLFTIVAAIWIAKQGYPGETIYLLVIGFLILSSAQGSGEVCPKCKQNVSFLPSASHLRLPKLSQAIRCCPYCGEDFS
jgi:hypothetical protein